MSVRFFFNGKKKKYDGWGLAVIGSVGSNHYFIVTGNTYCLRIFVRKVRNSRLDCVSCCYIIPMFWIMLRTRAILDRESSEEKER